MPIAAVVPFRAATSRRRAGPGLPWDPRTPAGTIHQASVFGGTRNDGALTARRRAAYEPRAGISSQAEYWTGVPFLCDALVGNVWGMGERCACLPGVAG